MREFVNALFHQAYVGGIVIAAVCLVRLLLTRLPKKAPRTVVCLLWLVVAVRLACPFSVQSPVGLLTTDSPISGEALEVQPSDRPSDTVGDTVTGTVTGTVTDTETLTPVMPPAVDTPTDSVGGDAQSNVTVAPPAVNGEGKSVNYPAIWFTLWAVGAAGLLLHGTAGYWRLRRHVAQAVPQETTWGRVYRCDNIRTPFVLGLLRPRVYVPTALPDASLPYVAAHEQAHVRRGDPWYKVLAYLLLAVYWFQPLCWLAFRLLCGDLEVACDERVLRSFGDEAVEQKKAYSTALLGCAAQGQGLSFCPVAFGGTDIKGRIKNVLHYKKPVLWITVTAVVLVVAVGVVLLTTRPAPDDPVDALPSVESTTTTTESTTTAPTTTTATESTTTTAELTTTTSTVPTSTTTAPTTTSTAATTKVSSTTTTTTTTAPSTTTTTTTKKVTSTAATTKVSSTTAPATTAATTTSTTAPATTTTTTKKATSTAATTKVSTTTAKPTTTTTTAATTSLPVSKKTTKKPTTTTRGTVPTRPTRNPNAPAVVNIVDHTDRDGPHTDVIDEFYFEGMYVYCFSYPHSVYVYYADGSTKPISQALRDRDIFIEDLDKYGIDYYWKELNKYIDIPEEELAEKYYDKSTIEDDFEEGVVLVGLCKTISATHHLFSTEEFEQLFGIELEDSEDLLYTNPYENPDALVNWDKYVQIYKLELPIKTKQAVLDAIKIIEQHPYVKSAGVNGYDYMEPDE